MINVRVRAWSSLLRYGSEGGEHVDRDRHGHHINAEREQRGDQDPAEPDTVAGQAVAALDIAAMAQLTPGTAAADEGADNADACRTAQALVARTAGKSMAVMQSNPWLE